MKGINYMVYQCVFDSAAYQIRKVFGQLEVTKLYKENVSNFKLKLERESEIFSKMKYPQDI